MEKEGKSLLHVDEGRDRNFKPANGAKRKINGYDYPLWTHKK